MKENQILKLLKTIKYPGFSRDIVSFGMVEKVTVEAKSVTISLRITTQHADKKNAVAKEVRDLLEKSTDFKDININLIDTPPVHADHDSRIQDPSVIHGDVKHIIAVASGKGGVGKSTVAANLAAALKAHGYAVGLLDLDIYGPSLPILLGINERPEITNEKKLIPLDKYGLKVMSFGFISGNDAPVIWRGPLVARMTEQFFGDVKWGILDYLILDLPPGTGDVQLTLTQKVKISGAVIVTTPQDIALADVRKGADMFKKVHTPVLGVIENMSGLLLEGTVRSPKVGSNDIELEMGDGNRVEIDEDGNFSLQVDLFKKGGGKQESGRLGVPLLGTIPIAKEIMEATDAGMPIVLKYPGSAITEIFSVIADSLVESVQ
jgi:ATP-binding protein involved in chromosome partitioning